MKMILIPKIRIQNANAMSSSFTVGFPAMSAWFGAVHALERKLRQSKFGNLKFKSFAVVSHKFDLHTYKGVGDYVYSVVGMGFPLDEEGKRSSFIEEARCHLTVSLLIECQNFGDYEFSEILSCIDMILNSEMKMAGGDILGFENSIDIPVQSEKDISVLIRKLMPGYFLIERKDLIREYMSSGLDALDAILSVMKIRNQSVLNDNGEVTWEHARQQLGWIVPIAVGFQGLTEVEKVKHQRDYSVPHRFAEAVVTLGEFKMVHHVKDVDDVLWCAKESIENDLYVCVQKNSI